MEIHVYIGNKSNGFACETLRQILVSLLMDFLTFGCSVYPVCWIAQ